MTLRAEPGPDAEAILVALVLVPGSFSRNKFFELFKHAKMKRARDRAALLRAVIRELSSRSAPVVERLVSDCGVELRYEIPTLRYKRIVRLSLLEEAVVNVAVAKGKGAVAPEEAQQRVHNALQALMRAA